MAEVTAPLALDETLQQVVSKLGNISSVAGASAYTQAVAGGYTGTQAEFEAQIAKQPIGVNPNLLDNWYFVGGGSQQGGGQFPINQKGQTTYSLSNAYGIDRWKQANTSLTVTLSTNGLNMAQSSSTNRRAFQQNIEAPDRLRGKVLTGSILLGDGSLYFGSLTIPEQIPSTQTNLSFVSTFGTDQSQLRVEINTSGAITITLMVGYSVSYTVRAIKVELGNTQTLAHNEGTDANPVWVLNEIPNYTEELWRCQRYYQLFASSSYRPTYGEDYRPPMRLHSPSKGTISIGGTTYYYADANL